jgi:TPR repeat protein
MLRFVLVVALFVALPLAARAADNDYEAGRTAAVAQDYAKAREIWEKLAAKGDMEAANSLGYLYQFGLGTPRDAKKAIVLYTQAAERGHANAANNIGVLYAKGEGVPADIAKAHAWYSVAAIQGEDSALANRKVAEQAMTFTQLQAASEEAREIIRRLVKNLTPAQIEAARKRAELYLADAKSNGGNSGLGVPRTRREGAPAGLVSPTQATGPSLSAPITVGGVGGPAGAAGAAGGDSGGSGPPRDPRLPSLTPMGGR